MDSLTTRHCTPCEGGTPPLESKQVAEYLSGMPGWSLSGDEKSISRKVMFRNFHETMAFVNAVAWIAHQEDHHPDLEVGYRSAVVRYTTHAIEGLSDNDFICAAKVDALLAPQGSR